MGQDRADVHGARRPQPGCSDAGEARKTDGARGSDLIVPARAIVATANVLIVHDRVPVFCDGDSLTHDIGPARAKRRT